MKTKSNMRQKQELINIDIYTLCAEKKYSIRHLKLWYSNRKVLLYPEPREASPSDRSGIVEAEPELDIGPDGQFISTFISIIQIYTFIQIIQERAVIHSTGKTITKVQHTL